MALSDFIKMQQQYQQNTPSQNNNSGTNSLLDMFKRAETESKEANLRRKTQIEGIFDEIINRYGPGGSFGQGYLEQLESQKVRETGRGAQSLISSGLAGTEMLSGLGRKWESEVGAPARLKLEDIRMERLSQAQTGKAGFLERINEPGPDFSTLAQAYAAQSATGSSGSRGGGSIMGGYGGGVGGSIMGGYGGGTSSVTVNPQGYNPLQDASRHPSSSGGLGGVGYSPSNSSGSGGDLGFGGGSGLEGLQAAAQSAEAARNNPGTPVYDDDGNTMYVFENGRLKKLVKDKSGEGWTRQW